MEFEQLIQQVSGAIRERVPVPDFRPGKLSIWLRLVRVDAGGEQAAGPAQKLIAQASSLDELYHTVAENALLAIYGAEAPIVRELPNLIVKLFESKGMVQVEGGPALNTPDQLFLKVTVYRYEPSLWKQLFGG